MPGSGVLRYGLPYGGAAIAIKPPPKQFIKKPTTMRIVAGVQDQESSTQVDYEMHKDPWVCTIFLKTVLNSFTRCSSVLSVIQMNILCLHVP